MLKVYNTLSREKEPFKPLGDKEVGMYSCGPTVYDSPHIGNLRTYIMVDVIKRYLAYKGYKVTHVMNITDVGHLTSDADEGEDKLETGAKREGKTVWEIAEYYTTIFKQNLKGLNILEPDIWAKATDHIQDQVDLIKKLEEKGYTYETREAIYFDISKFPRYEKLSRQPLEEKIVGARPEVAVDPKKRNPQDFALWFKLAGKFANHQMRWPSPWGEGFPGWHIECSAMSMKYLGESFDIHLGGADHIPVHHTNEIAQSEAATGKPFVRYWVHGEFLLVDGKKMAKSEGTFIALENLKEKGYSPLAFRLLCMQAHYRSKLNFTWESLKSAKESLARVENSVKNLLIKGGKGVERNERFEDYFKKFIAAMDDDFNTPQALSAFFDLLSQASSPEVDRKSMYRVLLEMDKVLGLGLSRLKPVPVIAHEGIRVRNEVEEIIPLGVLDLVAQREKERKKGNWEKADEVRKQLDALGYSIEDGEEYTIIKLT
ncbi:MAG: cysteine--tRNA ligase [Candidatus Portnoybacteria bacterium]|nr:cysteine--tRNA ligase [Candidatus Portnoybacteria bacterium]